MIGAVEELRRVLVYVGVGGLLAMAWSDLPGMRWWLMLAIYVASVIYMAVGLAWVDGKLARRERERAKH